MQSFLQSEFEPALFADATFHIIPAPLELSVSYGSGTANGPKAIIDASQQLEAFTGKSVPGELGIFTMSEIETSTDPLIAIDNIKKAVLSSLEVEALPIVLGGEHTVTLGAIKALQEKHHDFGVIQFDAHADLRDSYEESKFSHACVAKRIFDENIPIMQLGVRALSVEEHLLRKSEGIDYLDARDLANGKVPKHILPANFPEKIYITFDIDALDAAIMPATGTPEPGGLQWYQALSLLEQIVENKQVIGFDVVELAPINGLHYCQYSAARLVYEMMGIIN